MPYDLFISYARRDNVQGRITQLVERIKADFAPFARRELVPFFDQQESTACPTGGSASFKASANRACCSRVCLRRISENPKSKIQNRMDNSKKAFSVLIIAG